MEMTDPTPRKVFDDLVRGVPPDRPLFLPIVFSLGAKMENLPRQTYLANPTKIFNSARQVRSHLRSDGLICYFDTCLEAEALGGLLEWTENQPPALRWPDNSEIGQLPECIKTPEQAMQSGRVGVALEVIRRLKSVTRDGSLLTAGVTGLITVAARLVQLETADQLCFERLPDRALEIAASLMTQLSKAFVEAGADVVIIQEEILPSLTAENCDGWALLLGPAINIIRFYGGVPILNLARLPSGNTCDLILQQQWELVVSAPMDEQMVRSMTLSRSRAFGVALPAALLDPNRSSDEDLARHLDAISSLRPALVTTAEDLDWGADINRLKSVTDRLRDERG